MQPKVFHLPGDFHHMMAMRIFVESCSEWMRENKDFRYDITIEDIYFDFSQDWKYTAFITRDNDHNDSWQSLCPRDWELVVSCMDIDKLIQMAWYYMDNLDQGKIDVTLYPKFEEENK